MHENQGSRYSCGILFTYEGLVPESGSGYVANPNRMSAWLIRKGGVTVTAPGMQTARGEPGDWVIPRTGDPRNQYFDKGTEMLSICFKAELFGGVQAFNMKQCLIFKASAYPEFEGKSLELRDGMRGILDYHYNPGARGLESLSDLVQTESLFWSWFQLFIKIISTMEGISIRIPGKLDPRLESMLELLFKHEFGEGVPYRELELAVSLGRVQIDRIFQRSLGITPKAYMEQRTFDKACKMLFSSNIQVKELASELGFKSPSQFCFWFRKNAGQSPLAYKERRP